MPTSPSVRSRALVFVVAALIAAPLSMLPARPAHADDGATGLSAIPVSTGTGEKPQSKVWEHGGTWWAVLPSTTITPAGTWLWRMAPDETWSTALHLSDSTDAKVDVKTVGDVTHILLEGAAPELISIEYSADAYDFWSARPDPTSVSLPGSETATIDIDSTGRMWLSTETSSSIVAYYSDAPYSSFSGPITLATGINGDDISVVVALPSNEIGVLWSNQNTQRFGFRVHTDGADPATWSSDEVPASGSALNVGLGMADDHLNVAVASDGTLYAAVKTSYDTPGYPKIALLVRRPDGTWDPLYDVDDAGTRGIVLLNEVDDTVRVVYTSSEGYNDIVMRTSSTSSISFGPRSTLMPGGLNDATSTKDRWTDRVLVMASSATEARGVFIDADPGSSGEERGIWPMDDGSGMTVHDVSGLGNDGILSGNPTWVTGQIGGALHLDGTGDYALVPDDPSLDITGAITIAAWVRPEKQATQYLVKKATQGVTDGYELSLASSGLLFVRFNQHTSADTYRINSATSYPTDGTTWIHIAATYDGTTMKLYVNGAQESGDKAGPSAITSNALPLGIGAQSDGGTPLQGALDDVRLYAGALSAAEIATLAGIEPGNTAPVANDDAYSTGQDTTLNVAAPGVLANDTDADSDALSAVLDSEVSHGSLTLNSDGSFDYTPNLGFTGADSFTYHANDGTDDSNVATVSIITASDLRGWWEMEEGSGTSVIDSSGLGNDGTLSGNPTWITGQIGSALHLDGSGDYALVPDDPSLDITDEITIAAWVRPDQTGTQYLVRKGTQGGVDGYELSLASTSSTGKIFFRLNQATSGNTYRIDSTEAYPTDGTWVHIAATYDGSKIRLYINGVFDHEIDGPAAIASNALPLGIGAQSDGASTFQGALDDVRVYARALSLAEIEALAGVTPPANHAPVANDDTYGTGQDTLLNVAAPGVLGNDTDADADSLTAVQDTDVSHGSLTLNSNGSFDYTPANGWVGTDSFTYHANDGTDDSNVATVSITTNVDLRGWWQMDEGLGTTVGDSSLYDRTSTVFGAPLGSPARSAPPLSSTAAPTRSRCPMPKMTGGNHGAISKPQTGVLPSPQIQF